MPPKREGAKGVGSTTGAVPVAMSATSRPAPGPRPKPCPDMPEASNSPGTAANGPIAGRASGVTSMKPPQLRVIGA